MLQVQKGSNNLVKNLGSINLSRSMHFSIDACKTVAPTIPHGGNKYDIKSANRMRYTMLNWCNASTRLIVLNSIAEHTTAFKTQSPRKKNPRSAKTLKKKLY